MGQLEKYRLLTFEMIFGMHCLAFVGATEAALSCILMNRISNIGFDGSALPTPSLSYIGIWAVETASQRGGHGLWCPLVSRCILSSPTGIAYWFVFVVLFDTKLVWNALRILEEAFLRYYVSPSRVPLILIYGCSVTAISSQFKVSGRVHAISKIRKLEQIHLFGSKPKAHHCLHVHRAN